jgi:hypothetical protein
MTVFAAVHSLPIIQRASDLTHRGDWQPDLLREHSAEDDEVAVANKHVDEVVHGRQVQTGAAMLAG